MNNVILGIDPGSIITGYGIIEYNTNEFNYIFSGCIYLKNKIFINKLKIIYSEISFISKKFRPNSCAIEQVFIGKNMNSALKLSQARSAAMLAIVNLNIPVYEYTITQVKKYLSLSNNVNKIDIKNFIKNLLHISKFNISCDESDALALAITHHFKYK